jgi:hypothetical protein
VATGTVTLASSEAAALTADAVALMASSSKLATRPPDSKKASASELAEAKARGSSRDMHNEAI